MGLERFPVCKAVNILVYHVSRGEASGARKGGPGAGPPCLSIPLSGAYARREILRRLSARRPSPRKPSRTGWYTILVHGRKTSGEFAFARVPAEETPEEAPPAETEEAA